MLAASFISDFLIPVFFYLVEKFTARKRKRKQKSPGSKSGALHSRLARPNVDLLRKLTATALA